jgi:type I restriction enzyme, S subunit
MSLPRYPKYKDSGVEWLGEVPEHWEVYPIKRIACLQSGETINSEKIEEDGEFPVYGGNGLRGYTVSFTHEGEYALIGRQGALCGNVNYARGRFWASEHAVVVSPFKRTDTVWLGELLRSMNLNQYSISAAQPGLSVDAIRNLQVPVPPPSEQSHIAAFLASETGKIDALVEEQRRLIELLKEKRQAVICHAVAKGMNPDVPMKDSSIEWLGEVPAHWKQTVIKRFSKLQRGHDLTDEHRTDGPYPVVTSSGISGTHGSFMASAPGVVTGRYGSTGKLFYIEADFWPHNTSLYVIDFHGNNPRFVWYALQTVDFAAHSAKAAVPGIDRNDIHVLPVSVPPKDEQSAIVEYLDEESTRYDALIAEAARAIDLLQERRTALISAAVTGKIDVRGVATEDAK